MKRKTMQDDFMEWINKQMPQVFYKESGVKDWPVYAAVEAAFKAGWLVRAARKAK